MTRRHTKIDRKCKALDYVYNSTRISKTFDSLHLSISVICKSWWNFRINLPASLQWETIQTSIKLGSCISNYPPTPTTTTFEGVYWIHLVRPLSLPWRLQAPWFPELYMKFALEFRFQISRPCWLWPKAGAFWFWATSLWKWPPGGHIWNIFGSGLLVWLWISTPNINSTILVYMGFSAMSLS